MESKDKWAIFSVILVPRVESGELSLADIGLAAIMMTADCPLSMAELLAATGESRPTVLERLKRLADQGIIERFSTARSFQYRLSPAVRLGKSLLERKSDQGAVSSYSSSTTSLVKEIVNDLNRVSGKKYRWNSAETKAKIIARLNDEFTLADFKKVHRNKLSWLNDPKMNKYYRPETLYAPSKFEAYLNESSSTPAPVDDHDDLTPENVKEKYRHRLKYIANLLEKEVINEKKAQEYRGEAKASFAKLFKKASR